MKMLGRMIFPTSCPPVGCAIITSVQIRLKLLGGTSRRFLVNCTITISTRSELCTARLQRKHTRSSSILSNRRLRRMAELKPCPFCGGTKLKIDRKSRLAGWNGLDKRVEMHTYSVRCNTCHARGGAVGGRVMNDPWTRCAQLPDWATTDKSLEAKATEAWNRRADNG